MSDSPEPRRDGLLTVREAAEKLRCSTTNLYSLIEAGEIPVVVVGKAKGYRIDPFDILNFVRLRKQTKIGAPTRTRAAQLKLKHIRLK